MDDELLNQVKRLVLDLVAGQYAAIAADGRAGRLSEEELRIAVTEYGHTLIPLPQDGLTLVEVFPNKSNPDMASVNIPLWTQEEGHSDLTLSVTATKYGDRYTLHVEDLHVL